MTDQRREPDEIIEEPQTREQDSADADEHNERMRTHGATFEVPAGVRTVRAMRNRRRVIE